MQSEPARIVFVMPRCRHYHIRSVHKQACLPTCAGYEVLLVVKQQLVDEYRGTQVIAAHIKFEFHGSVSHADSLAPIRQADIGLQRRMGEVGERFVATECNWEQTSDPFLSLVDGLSQDERIAEARLQ